MKGESQMNGKKGIRKAKKKARKILMYWIEEAWRELEQDHYKKMSPLMKEFIRSYIHYYGHKIGRKFGIKYIPH